MINNILIGKKRKDDKYDNDYQYIYSKGGPNLISFSHSNFRYSYFTLMTKTGLKRLAAVKALYIDMTWFKRERGIIVLSEKIQYSYYYNNVLHQGIRAIPWCFIHTRSRDNFTLQEIFSAIKLKVNETVGTNWDPLHIYVDFDGATIIALQKFFPFSSIKFYFFHLLQAIRKRANKVFGKSHSGLVVIEFTKFWFNTKSMDTFFVNLKIFEDNLKEMFEDNSVNAFISYIKRNYVNKKGVDPLNWMHFLLKEYYFYDGTNNTSESLNRALKRNEILPFTLKKSMNKMIATLKRYENIFLNELCRKPSYRYSVKRARRQKNIRMNEYVQKQVELKERFNNIKEYN